MQRKPAPSPEPSRDSIPPEPRHAAADWRAHDLLIRHFHDAGLIPSEIAVALNSKGLRVRTWAVSETFVRNRLAALKLEPRRSRTVYATTANVYRPRPALRGTGVREDGPPPGPRR